MKPYKCETNSATFLVYDRYIIAEPKLFVDVYKKEVDQLYAVVSGHIKGKFGLIENRVNKNSINPLAYQYAEGLMPDFSAFALVVYTELAKQNIQIEKYFIAETKIKAKIFDSLDDAKEWMVSVL
ncbi:hypothetical protein ACFL35_12415 [Candidatus Riflebacteria bacterium]